MKFLILFLSCSLYGSAQFSYDQLYAHCEQIRSKIIAMKDVRMNQKDQIETAITLYLKKVGTLTAYQLLTELQENDFDFDLFYLID